MHDINVVVAVKSKECRILFVILNCLYLTNTVFLLIHSALPALHDAPLLVDIEGTIRVSWNIWRPGYDYGTGPVDSYRVNYKPTNNSSEDQKSYIDTNSYYLNLTDSFPICNYTISVSVIRVIEGQATVGASSPPVFAFANGK